MSTITYATVIATGVDDDAPNYGRNADGYGRKIATRYWVMLAGESRWRRVYAVCFSNAASLYVVVNGEDVWIDEHDITG